MTAAPKKPKTGGRAKGVKNKSTIQREELARAQIAQSLERAKKAGIASPRIAMDEMYKAITIAEGVAGKLQPKSIDQGADGKLIITGGDLKGFGEWFDRYTSCIKELMKYQCPPMKAVEAPTPPPDPADVERRARKRFGLRVFEGGKPIQPLATASDDK